MATLFRSVKMLIKIEQSSTSAAKLHIDTSLNSPFTPCSPITPAPIKIEPISLPRTYSVESIIKQQGYMPELRVTNTLQGSIWKVTAIKQKKPKDTNIIKVASKSLHKKHIAYIDEKAYQIQENIVKEIGILRFLSSSDQNPPNALIRYIDSFVDAHNYFLVMEDGGVPLFDVVKECHELIKRKTIRMKQWHLFCKTAMKQMVEVLDWMHEKMHCCHLDVSLENFSIKNMQPRVVMQRNACGAYMPNMQLSKDFQIKIIDFGLAEVFTSKNDDGRIDFRCNKYVGKKGYKAPKVYNKKRIFDARSADCWSLAVCFFMMFFGCAPFHKPSKSDLLFTFVGNGQIMDIVESWGLLHYANAEIFDLLLRLFVPEKYRLTITDIKEHAWLKPLNTD